MTRETSELHNLGRRQGDRSLPGSGHTLNRPSGPGTDEHVLSHTEHLNLGMVVLNKEIRCIKRNHCNPIIVTEKYFNTFHDTIAICISTETSIDIDFK